jgi:predicted nucleic acid-binding protein
VISAIDSNVLLDILIPNDAFADAAAAAIEDAAAHGSLVVTDIVYAEICVQFPTHHDCDHFFNSNEIRVDHLIRSAHFLASRIRREYRAQGGKRNRILPDFLIGAHAQVQTNPLISRDRGFYRTLFPKLTLVNPADMV